MKQLRLTTTPPHSMFEGSDDLLVKRQDIGKIINCKLKGRTAYIHGEAEEISGFDIPVFLDGDMAQLDLSVEDQNILLLLPSGEYPLISTLQTKGILDNNAYYLTLKK